MQMYANPFDDPRDYGTVSGQSTGFRTGEPGKGPEYRGHGFALTTHLLSADEFSRLQQKVANGVQEIKKLS